MKRPLGLILGLLVLSATLFTAGCGTPQCSNCDSSQAALAETSTASVSPSSTTTSSTTVTSTGSAQTTVSTSQSLSITTGPHDGSVVSITTRASTQAAPSAPAPASGSLPELNSVQASDLCVLPDQGYGGNTYAWKGGNHSSLSFYDRAGTSLHQLQTPKWPHWTYFDRSGNAHIEGNGVTTASWLTYSEYEASSLHQSQDPAAQEQEDKGWAEFSAQYGKLVGITSQYPNGSVHNC